MSKRAQLVDYLLGFLIVLLGCGLVGYWFGRKLALTLFLIEWSNDILKRPIAE